ncbi:MAG: uroporphyrinogen-III synthase, partial [Balneolaceae bacterium]
RPVWVFTSQNGVHGFSRSVRPEGYNATPEQVYAVGDSTAEAVREETGCTPRVPDRQDAVWLARLMLDDLGSGEGVTVIHWCGNRRRPELEDLLREAKVLYVPVEVYLTELNRMSFPDREVEAVLFYSPSAVEAFRNSNGFSRKLPDLFAIGQTTAEQLSMESGGNVHVPARPSTESLLQLVAGVLSHRPSS